MLNNRIKNNLSDKCGLKSGSKIVLGVSGGPDSICLLDILSKLEFGITVAHLNHNLRPESAEEEKFVKNQAGLRGLRFVSASKDIREMAEASNKGIEEMARTVRYQFLFNTALEYSASAVITAHHADDQVETILMNFIRGAGLDGLTGMDYRTYSEFNDKIPLVRPMLDTWRNEITDYCEKSQLEYMTDISNRDVRYQRNRVRIELIPYLEDYNPNIKQTILRMSDILQIDERYLEKITENRFSELVEERKKGEISINLKSFQQTSLSIQRRILKIIFERYFQDQMEIDLYSIETARRYLTREIESTNGILKESVVVLVGGEKARILTLAKLDQNELWPAVFDENTVPVKSGKYQINKNLFIEITIMPVEEVADRYTVNPDSFIGYMDLDAIGNTIQIRSAKSGDKFAPLGMYGKTMKLTDFWINKKIPKMARKNWPVVTSGKKIIWLPGFMPSHDSRITAETETVAVFQLIRMQ